MNKKNINEKYAAVCDNLQEKQIINRGGGNCQKVGAQFFTFYYLRLKKWVRSCELCALGPAAPAWDKGALFLLNMADSFHT